MRLVPLGPVASLVQSSSGALLPPPPQASCSPETPLSGEAGLPLSLTRDGTLDAVVDCTFQVSGNDTSQFLCSFSRDLVILQLRGGVYDPLETGQACGCLDSKRMVETPSMTSEARR